MSLNDAAMGGYLSIVKYLTQEMKINPSFRDSSNNTQLHYAALNGHIDVVDFFIFVKV